MALAVLLGREPQVMEAVGLYSFFLPIKTPKLREESQYFGSEACSALCRHKESGNMK